MDKTVLTNIALPRPTGTEGNEKVNGYIENRFADMGLQALSLPFSCAVWEEGEAILKAGSRTFEAFVNPFSLPFEGVCEVVSASTLSEIEGKDLSGKILLLFGPIASEQIQPKDYPFYYPDEHKALIEALEAARPRAIIAATGKSDSCGADPFPLFADGAFDIPGVYVSENNLSGLLEAFKNSKAELKIISARKPAEARQIIARREGEKGRGKIVICAHMDSQYSTPGALDNAAGVCVMLCGAQKLFCEQQSFENLHTIEFVPFNGEESYGAWGELCYAEYCGGDGEAITAVINIDSPCHLSSKTAAACMNFTDEQLKAIDELISKHPDVEEGELWYSGDHAAYAFSGIPCIALSSSDLFEGGLENTHTLRDTPDDVDEKLIESAGEFTARLTMLLDRLMP
ncbi:MAG: M28 family peptidase [Eubacteriaceae bacterium]|nr:M28 family peptidase [Eubacteriaceae bacterium]